MTDPTSLGWFEAVGLEIEYAIVDRRTLEVRPEADRLLADDAGHPTTERVVGELAWTNELALHVLEIKTLAPAKAVADVGSAFRRSVDLANDRLAESGACLMPTGMHPWMDPRTETVLWPHQDAEIYAAFDRVFDCRRHGYANVQSQQINLPFRDDAELGRLHAATRLVLPLLPALAASSPFEGGRHRDRLDGRLAHYASLTARVPSLAGRIVPEAVFSEQGYRRDVLSRIDRDLARLGVADVLEAEWCNGRGCIPRFDRRALEIRLLDTQECPEADLAVAAAVTATVRWIADTVPAFEQRRFTAEALARILDDVVVGGSDAVIEDVRFLRAMGVEEVLRATAGDVWQHLLGSVLADASELALHRSWLDRILAEGPLARRILSRLGPSPEREALHEAYGELCACLARGTPFSAGGVFLG